MAQCPLPYLNLNEFYTINKRHFCAVQAAYVFFYTLDALISARKKFLTFEFIR